MHSTPVEVVTEARFVDISVGADHACAVATDAIVHCWGSNRHGQLGGGLDGSWWYAVEARGLFNQMPMPFISVSAGHRYSCGVSAFPARQIFCWGRTGEHLGMGPAS